MKFWRYANKMISILIFTGSTSRSRRWLVQPWSFKASIVRTASTKDLRKADEPLRLFRTLSGVTVSDDAPHRDGENRGKASGKRCDICRRLPTGKTLLLVCVQVHCLLLPPVSRVPPFITLSGAFNGSFRWFIWPERHYPPKKFLSNCESLVFSLAKGHFKLSQCCKTNPFCFLRGKYIVKSAKKRSADIFVKPTAARKFGNKILSTTILGNLNVQLKNSNRSNCIGLHKFAFLKDTIWCGNAVHDILTTLL